MEQRLLDNIDYIINHYYFFGDHTEEEKETLRSLLIEYTNTYKDNQSLLDVFSIIFLGSSNHKNNLLYGNNYINYLNTIFNQDNSQDIDTDTYVTMGYYYTLIANMYEEITGYARFDTSDNKLLTFIEEIFCEFKGVVNPNEYRGSKDRINDICKLAIYRNISKIMGYTVNSDDFDEDDIFSKVSRLRNNILYDKEFDEKIKTFYRLNGINNLEVFKPNSIELWNALYKFVENCLLELVGCNQKLHIV